MLSLRNSLTREEREFLPLMLDAQLRGMDERRRDGATVERLQIVACGTCGARPGEPRSRGCQVANCGLIGRAHHGTGDSL